MAAGRTEYLQIRVTAAEKATLRRLAAQAGQDLSAYVLGRALPDARARFAGLLGNLKDDSQQAYALAALNDYLAELPAPAFHEAVLHGDVRGLSPFAAAYAAAMVEQAAARKGCAPPAWTGRVPALDEPWFAAGLRSLRPWLLVASPVPFRRRNLFIDTSIGGRV